MSKIPAPASSHSKPRTASSAWSRLVQATRTASKTSRHDDAKAPLRRRSMPASASSMSESSRPAKRRRVTMPASLPTIASSSSASLMSQQDASQTEEASIEVCACLEGEPPLADGRCSLSQLGKRNSAATRVLSSPTHVDLRTFWGSRAAIRLGGQSWQEDRTHESQELDSGEAGDKVTAAKSADNGSTPDFVRESSRYDMEDDSPGQLAGRAVVRDIRTGLSQRDVTDTNHTIATMTTRRLPTEDARAGSKDGARLSSMTSSLRGGFRSRHKSSLIDKTSRLEVEPAQDGHSIPSKKKLDIIADPEADEPRTRPRVPDTPRSPTPAFQKSTMDTVNRAPEPNQLATPTSSQSSTSSTTDKENRPARKPKRRLTLHSTQPQRQKKRKEAPKETVQTTLALAIGGSAGMRECKVCDTVYNPFHPEDVKVHAKRHAGVVRKERGLVGV